MLDSQFTLAPSRILVTGACGSVGVTLVERLLNDGHTVCAFDHSEDGLFRLDQKHIHRQSQLRLFVGDIRDLGRLKHAMEEVQYVFHCAALKHVYLSEYNPFETMQTNIIGTNNVIQAALNTHVSRVIFTSSDKAVNPSSTMGASKLLGERIITAANHHVGKHDTKFAVVRFGNVLNSNGSVLQIFRQQIKEGKPLTITSTDMTRFFLSMQQAVDLCIETASRMCGGEIFVKNMGSCNIVTLARVITGDQRPFKYVEIGLKPGEKLYEELVTGVEAPRTVINANTYIILPETNELMPEPVRKNYSIYDKFNRLSSPLCSDSDLLSEADVSAMLHSAGLLD